MVADAQKAAVHRDEVAKHKTAEDCWVVINGHAYDLSTFADEHPGGSGIIVKYAGRDASRVFNPIHPKDIVDTLPGAAHLGPVTPAEPPPEIRDEKDDDEDEEEEEEIPDISQMVNVWDFELVAKRNVTKEAWAYLMSGADDEVSFRENHAAFHRIMLKPRVLVNVADIDMSTTVLGVKMSIPIYITSCALGRLYHEDGECCLARGARMADVPQLCPTLASCTMDEMHAAREAGLTQWWQLYVNRDRELTKTVIQKAERLGFKALFVTVDAPLLGRRERDMRNKAKLSANVQTKQKDKIPTNQGTTRAISSFIDPSLNWNDLPWVRECTKMPIILKGIQTGEDAVRSYAAGMDGIVVSNHGGRQLDHTRSGIEMLVEVMDALHGVNADLDKFTVLVDGGFRRGSDIFKALALGAKAVGIGRPSLVGMAAYGDEGVAKVVQIFKDELEMHMRLMGTPAVADMKRDMVITRNIHDHFTVAPTDFLSSQVYSPLPLATRMSKM